MRGWGVNRSWFSTVDEEAYDGNDFSGSSDDVLDDFDHDAVQLNALRELEATRAFDQYDGDVEAAMHEFGYEYVEGDRVEAGRWTTRASLG